MPSLNCSAQKSIITPVFSDWGNNHDRSGKRMVLKMFRLTSAAFSALMFVCLSYSAAYAQVTPSPYPRQPPTSGPISVEERQLNQQLRESLYSLGNGPDGPSNFSREDLGTFPKFLSDRREDLLRPTKAERAPYAVFLKQPQTGLVKLIPRPAKVVDVRDLLKTKKGDQTPSMFPGGGAFYSFTQRRHSPDFADIKIKDGQFEVGFGSDVLAGILSLGDVPIDSLTNASQGVQALAQYPRPSRRKQAIAEFDQFKRGVKLDSYDISTAAAVRENTSYALRSIAYGSSDQLVVFRVVKQNTDGSVLLLWKRVARQSAPKLKK